MRTILIALAVSLVAVAVLAAEPETPKTQISVFTSDLGFSVSDNHSARTGGYGIALSHEFTPRWSAELKVANERHYGSSVTYDQSGNPPAVQYRTFRVIPVDALAQYRFPNSSRWTPYVSAGVHYASAPTLTFATTITDVNGNVHQYDRSVGGSRVAGEVGIGTSLRITPHFGMRFDLNAITARDRYYDHTVRPSFGVNWRF